MRLKVLAFEDNVDIEALLISGGVAIEKLDFLQYWDSTNHLNRIKEFSPEILLLDHYMPPTKGLQVVIDLLASNISKPETIVAMSSASMANQAMKNAGADLGIVKFELAKLDIWPRQS